MATEVFKIVNDMSPEHIKDLITIQNSSYNFRRENHASIPQVKSTRYGLRSLHYEAPEFGTVSRTIRERLSLFHSSGGCSMLGMASFVNDLRVLFRLVLFRLCS